MSVKTAEDKSPRDGQGRVKGEMAVGGAKTCKTDRKLEIQRREGEGGEIKRKRKEKKRKEKKTQHNTTKK